MRYQELLEASKPPAYPAKARYDYYNGLLFDGKLPEIPIKFKNLKGLGGVVNARVRFGPARSRWNKYFGATLIPGSMEMILSSRYLRTLEQQDAILLHEMIHVYFNAIGDFAEEHGGKFIKMARDIGVKVGFEIPLKDNVDDLAAADTSVKPGVVMVVNRGRSGRLYAVLSPSVLNKKDELAAGVSRMSWGDNAVCVYKIASPTWSDYMTKHRIQRIAAKPKLYIETEKMTALLDELERDGQVIALNVSKSEA